MVRKLSYSNFNDFNILPSQAIDQNQQNLEILGTTENQQKYNSNFELIEKINIPTNQRYKNYQEDKNSDHHIIKVDQDHSVVMRSNSKSRSNSFIRGSPKRFLEMKSQDQTDDSNHFTSYSGNKLQEFKMSAKKLALSSFKESSIGMDEVDGQQDETDKSLLEHRQDVKNYIRNIKNKCSNLNHEFDRRHSQLFSINSGGDDNCNYLKDNNNFLQISPVNKLTSINDQILSPIQTPKQNSTKHQQMPLSKQISINQLGKNSIDNRGTIFSMDNSLNQNTMQLYDSIYEKKLQETKYTSWRSQKNIETFNPIAVKDSCNSNQKQKQNIKRTQKIQDDYESQVLIEQNQLNETNTDSKVSTYEYQSVQIEQEINPEDKRSSVIKQKLQDIQDQLTYTQNALRNSSQVQRLDSLEQQNENKRFSNQYKRDPSQSIQKDNIDGIEFLRNSIDLKLKTIMNKKQAYMKSDEVENQDICEISNFQDKSDHNDAEQSPEFSVHITPTKDEQISLSQNDQTLKFDDDSHERSHSRSKFNDKIHKIRQRLNQNEQNSYSQERLLNIQDQSLTSSQNNNNFENQALKQHNSPLQRSRDLLQNFQANFKKINDQNDSQIQDLKSSNSNKLQKQIPQDQDQQQLQDQAKELQLLKSSNIYKNNVSDFMSRTYAMDINESFGDNKFFSQGYIYKISSKRQSIISQNQDRSLDFSQEYLDQNHQNLANSTQQSQTNQPKQEPKSIMNQIRQSIQKSLQECRSMNTAKDSNSQEYIGQQQQNLNHTNSIFMNQNNQINGFQMSDSTQQNLNYIQMEDDQQQDDNQEQFQEQQKRLSLLNDEIEYTRVSSKKIIEIERQKMKVLNEEFERQQKLLQEMNSINEDSLSTNNKSQEYLNNFNENQEEEDDEDIMSLKTSNNQSQ